MSNTFNGTEGAKISLELAAQYTANWRAAFPYAPTSAVIPLANYIGKDAILEILAQNEAVGIRSYYGIDNEGIYKLILVGVNTEGNDLLDIIYNNTLTCPIYCSAANALNLQTS